MAPGVLCVSQEGMAAHVRLGTPGIHAQSWAICKWQQASCLMACALKGPTVDSFAPPFPQPMQPLSNVTVKPALLSGRLTKQP